MFGLFQDIRFAVRQLLKDRSAAIAIIVTVALGIGVNTAIYSIINGLLRPLPVPQAEQIVVVAAQTTDDETGFRFTYSYPAFDDMRRQAVQSMDVFALTYMFGGLSTGERSTRFFYGAVSGNFFSALDVKPLHGRFFQPGEGENTRADLTVVLGHTFWQKRFGGDPGVIGKQIRINGKSATIIGVVQKDFHGVFAGADMDGYMPLRSRVSDGPRPLEIFTNREWRDLTVYARLKPQISIEQAQASLSTIARRLEDQYPATDRGIGVRVIPEPRARPLPLRYVVEAAPFVHFFLLFLAVLVLLLACMNVANILLVRTTVRRRELAIRATLGSGRWRLVRQMLAESIFLSSIGAVAGTLLGNWTSRAFAASLDLGTDLPVLLDFGFDWRVFSYALLAALSTGMFIGLLPAFRASRTTAAAVLHDGGWGGSGGRDRQRARSVLVIGQVAGSLVLLVSAGLFVRSLRNAEHVELGFDPRPLLLATMDPHWAGYNAERTNDFYRELGRRVRAWPEVQAASFAFSVPMGYYSAGMTIYRDESPVVPGEQAPIIGCNFIDGDYFQTMQIPILRGRAFRESDNEKAPLVAIVNQTMAKRFWPNEDPIGKRFHLRAKDAPLVEVVGVAKDGKYLAVFEGSLPHMYLPQEQNYGSMRTLHIRSTAAPALLGPRLRREIEAVDPDVPVTDIQTMNRSLGGAFGFLIFRIGAIQAGTLAILGLVLAVVGVYGVVSYGAAQRTREIGIRMALGATPRSVLGLVIRHGAWMIVVGIAIGLVGAAALTRLIGRFLLLVSPLDPLTFLTVVFLLAFVALWACYLPARRATRVEPMIALRHE